MPLGKLVYPDHTTFELHANPIFALGATEATFSNPTSALADHTSHSAFKKPSEKHRTAAVVLPSTSAKKVVL